METLNKIFMDLILFSFIEGALLYYFYILDNKIEFEFKKLFLVSFSTGIANSLLDNILPDGIWHIIFVLYIGLFFKFIFNKTIVNNIKSLFMFLFIILVTNEMIYAMIVTLIFKIDLTQLNSTDIYTRFLFTVPLRIMEFVTIYRFGRGVREWLNFLLVRFQEGSKKLISRN